jgi:hypothetical protein
MTNAMVISSSAGVLDAAHPAVPIVRAATATAAAAQRNEVFI